MLPISELRGLTRRDALRAAAVGGALTLTSGVRVHARPRSAARDTLVVVFLRGGADGLSIVVPYQDPHYHALRPTLGIGAADVSDLDGTFGLCRTAGALRPWYDAGQLAFVQAIGGVNPTRSHFEAMWRIEQAAVAGGNLGSGWLGRHLESTAPASPAATARGVAVGPTLPGALNGSPETMAVQCLGDLRLGGPAATVPARAAAMHAMLAATPPPDGPRGATSLRFLEALHGIDFAGRTPAGGAVYPASNFGRALHETATLILADLGVEAIEVDLGGWDHHRFSGPLDGALAGKVRTLSEGLAAFLTDLGPAADRTTVLVLSEFGRRVDENGSSGFDHGRGGLAMVLGGAHVRGGQVHGVWPGLAPHQLDDDALAVTTDVRDLFAELLVRRMGTADLSAVLPGHTPTPLGVVG